MNGWTGSDWAAALVLTGSSAVAPPAVKTFADEWMLKYLKMPTAFIADLHARGYTKREVGTITLRANEFATIEGGSELSDEEIARRVVEEDRHALFNDSEGNPTFITKEDYELWLEEPFAVMRGVKKPSTWTAGIMALLKLGDSAKHFIDKSGMYANIEVATGLVDALQFAMRALNLNPRLRRASYGQTGVSPAGRPSTVVNRTAGTRSGASGVIVRRLTPNVKRARTSAARAAPARAATASASASASKARVGASASGQAQSQSQCQSLGEIFSSIGAIGVGL